MNGKQAWRLTRRGETRDEKFNRLLPRGEEHVCWEWPALGTNGYGILCHDKRRYYAHRVSYEVHKGPIPDGLHILHACDNPACANPAHLSAGTHAENMREAGERGRMNTEPTVLGSAHPLAKLTEDKAREIKRAAGKYRDIAKDYGIALSLVGRIKRGVSWPHI